MKKKLVQFVEKREQRRSGSTPSVASLHSMPYHRHFEGYTEVRRIGPDGKCRIERVYTADYRVQALDGRRRAELRLAYVLLWAAGVGLFGYASTRYVGSNGAVYVNLAQAVAVAGLAWVAGVLFNYLTAPRKLTIHEYRSTSPSLCHASMTAATALLASGVLTLLHLLLQFRTAGVGEALCAGLLALSAGCLFLVNRLEHRVPYSIQSNENASPEEGSHID